MICAGAASSGFLYRFKGKNFRLGAHPRDR
jgi:hypothetical protein